MEQSPQYAIGARVCRLCLCSRGEILPIFSSSSNSDSDSSLLASKIEACVSIEITEDDKLPACVCRKCLNNVNNWHAFKKVCVESQAKLQDWLENDVNVFDKVVADIKPEPYFEDSNDIEEDIAIDSSHSGSKQIASASAYERIHPEGPPILASLGLAPRNEKEAVYSEDEEEEEEEKKELTENDKLDLKTSISVENSKSFQHSATSQESQLVSKNCLVCGRSYRYSHNARRHELTAHKYDRYTNKIKGKAPKLKPNPFNPKARLLPNPNNPKSHLFSKVSDKLISSTNKLKSHPYHIKIKSLSDLQIKVKRPEILKTLLTTQPDKLASEPEVTRSGSESPETLVSEPEISSYQVETVLTEPESIENNVNNSEDDCSRNDAESNQNRRSEMVEIDTDNEVEIAKEMDINKIIGVGENGEIDSQGDETNDQVILDPSEVSQDVPINDKDQDIVDIEEPIIQDESAKSPDVESEHEGCTNIDDGVSQDEDDDIPLVPIAPIVEISEELKKSFSPDINDESKTNEEEEDQYLKIVEKASGTVVTKAQKEFIEKYRDVIEQINTKECHCCQKVHPRRKAVIQHLQKIGLEVRKHTCYNCVVTFGHIGALLSHMRANICTDLWKIIYKEGGITENMVIEEEAEAPVQISKYDPSANDSVNIKNQYKDILSARSYACKLCPAKFQLKLLVMKHVIDVHENGFNKIPLLCQHCGCRFKENRLWKKHTRNGECTVNIACDLCPERFLNMIYFHEHALAVHAGVVDQVADNSSKTVDGRSTYCEICDKNMSSYHNLVKHLRNVHDEQYPHMCKCCDAKFEVVSELNNHIYTEHNEHAVSVSNELNLVKQEVEECHYTCTDCDSAFDSVDAFTDHQVNVHGQEAHHCDQCDRKFLQVSDLTEHKNSHLKVKFYTCTLCSNSYGTPERLNEHMQSSHNDTNNSPDAQFYCNVCARAFKSRQAFSNHMRIHAKVPTHNKRTGNVRSPSSHRIIKPNPVYQDSLYIPYQKPMSSLDAPYSCDICGKGFVHKKNIWKHKKVLHPEIVSQMKSPNRYISLDYSQPDNPATEEEDYYGNDENSTGLSIPQFDSFTAAAYEPFDNGIVDELPFKCDICSKKFSAESGMWKHKRIKHGIVADAGEPNRTNCTICKITFSDKKSYYRHRKNVHKVSTQMCKICGKHLNSALELYEHLKAAHARELLGYNASQGGSKRDEVNNMQEYSDGDLSEDKHTPQTDSYQAQYPCDTCGKHFLGMLALQNHQCKKSNDPNETFDCEICHKSYTSISALKSHRGWHLRSPDGKAAANNSGLWMPHNKVTNKVSKHEVLEMLPSRKSFNQSPAASFVPQLKRKLPPEVEVTIVNSDKKKRVDEEADSIHLLPRSSIPSEDRYCNICDKEFTKKAAYQRHMEEVHQPNSVFCPVCNKSFTRKSTLLVHMRKHYDTDETYDMGDIELGLGMVDAMVDFAPTPQNTNLYPCDICGVHYRSSKALRKHRLRRHPDLFVSGNANSASMSVVADESEDDGHEEEEEDVGNLVMPLQGPGEFTCNQCGDGVASPRDLIIHRQMHNTPSKFHCNVCRVYFARAIDLSAHTRARHADNDKVFFPCAMCDRFYMNKKSLQRHIENAH